MALGPSGSDRKFSRGRRLRNRELNRLVACRGLVGSPSHFDGCACRRLRIGGRPHLQSLIENLQFEIEQPGWRNWQTRQT
jgi:hypothetical protein